MAAEQISLFDVGALGLLTAWLLCWAVRFGAPRLVARAIPLVTGLSAAAMLVAIVWRGVLAGHVPLTSAYEFCLLFVLLTVIAYALAAWRTAWAPLGLGVLPIPLLCAAYAHWAIAAQKQAIQPLAPALQSVWLPFHVVTAAAAYAGFAVAAGAAGWWLLTMRLAERETLERAVDGAVAGGYLCLTASMLTGAIWAQMAWGSYWSWDPKEVWTLVTWLIYTIFLHARRRRSWTGRPLMVLALLGFAAVLWTFLGIGPLVRWTSLQSLHVF